MEDENIKYLGNCRHCFIFYADGLSSFKDEIIANTDDEKIQIAIEILQHGLKLELEKYFKNNPTDSFIKKSTLID